jgi:hypothetical protein
MNRRRTLASLGVGVFSVKALPAIAGVQSLNGVNFELNNKPNNAPSNDVKDATNSAMNASQMQTRRIGNSAERMPVVGLGTWQTFDIAQSNIEALTGLELVLKEFANLGGTVIDSSPMYGRSEEVAGQLIANLKLNINCSSPLRFGQPAKRRA